MATVVDPDFFARLDALNDKFAASVPDTLARLRLQRAACHGGAPDASAAKDLHHSLHTIAGSAATFGFPVFGQQARNLEQRMRVLMASESAAAGDWHRWLEALDDYLRWAELDPKAASYPGG